MARIYAVGALALAIEVSMAFAISVFPRWGNTPVGVGVAALAGVCIGLCVAWLWTYSSRHGVAQCEHGIPFSVFCWECVERDANK